MEQAFSMIEDNNKIFEEAMKMITAPDRSEVSIFTALEVIDRACDDPDVARNAKKLNGVQPLLDLLASHPGAVSSRACEIIALLCSNNPTIQEAYCNCEALDLLMRFTRESPAGSEERSKAFRALSSLIRGLEAQEVAFVAKGGVDLLVELLAPTEAVQAREKAASLTRSLVQDDRMGADDVVRLAATFPALLNIPEEVGIQYRELLASCVCQVAKVASMRCPPELAAAVRGRIARIRESPSDDTAQELATLHECATALASCGTMPPAA